MILFIISLYIFNNINNSKKNQYKINMHSKKSNNNNHKNNNQFIQLYREYLDIDNKIMQQQEKVVLKLEDINYNHSYTPKKLLDDRVIIHIDLDNEDYKDGLGF